VSADLLPKPPAFLDRIGKAAWRRLVSALNDRGLLLADLDFGLLESWCTVYAAFVNAQEAVRKNGATFTTSTGYVGPRPEIAIAHKSRAQLKALGAELGLSTAARARMNVTALPEPGEPSLAEILLGAPVDKSEGR